MIVRSEIVGFKLKPEEAAQLREAAAHRGITLSEVVRDALLQALMERPIGGEGAAQAVLEVS